VVAVRGYLPEARVSTFAHAFYRRIFAGDAPRDAFAAAEAQTDREGFATTTGSFVLLETPGSHAAGTRALSGGLAAAPTAGLAA
jgi:hypothetical protein